MKLYGSFTSPYVRHCRIALLQSGMSWELIETDYATSAKVSPTKKVPFFEDRGLTLSDSSSILRYIRDHSATPCLATVEQLDRYCLVNTLLDSAINLFLLEKDGLTGEHSDYLKRQQARLTEGLNHLEQSMTGTEAINDDALWRLVCFLDWGLFRQRFDLAGFDKLTALLERARTMPVFADTAPE